MSFIYVLILLLTGLVTGFASGLLGVGGAFIMTPVQYYIYEHIGINPDVAIRLAFGTNLLVILPTALSGTWSHQRHGNVRWKTAIIMGSCSLLGGLAGATISSHIPGEILKMAFGALVLFSAIRMVIGTRIVQSEAVPRENTWLLIALAIPIGIVTGMLGIGGGVIVIPVMTIVLKYSMRIAAGTSLAMMIFTSIGGVIGYIVNGVNMFDLPAFSIGYVDIQVWLLLAVTSTLLAQVGARMSRKIPEKPLRYIFIVLMLYVGLRMLGVFEIFGLNV